MNFRQIFAGITLATIAAQADISYEPITSGATESAKKLYNFLATNFERKTVSGIQTGELINSVGLKSQPDLKAVNDVCGKYPALVGFDFLFATGKTASDSWYKEYTNKTISLAIELWKNGGIPAFSWHWKDPSDSVDAFYVKGAGDPYTTFDFSKAFITGTTDWETSSGTYKQLVSDIDEIAALFKTLQDSGVGAIFRPLHECGGNWFWWSTKTPAQYAALYRLVYTRMTETSEIKNLVWVWNPQEAVFDETAWNPGPTYYDVIGVDIYNAAYNYKSNSDAFKSMKTRFGTNKILALSENGPIPDASLMQADSAIWSWYMPWYESWDGKFVSRTKNTVWKANLESSCIYTLDKMPGWDEFTINTTKVTVCNVDYKLGDLDTAVELQAVQLDTSNGNGWLKITVNNMQHEINDGGDTTLYAGANVYIEPSNDFSGAKTASFTAYNTSLSGVWISVAILTNETWDWEMPPEGKWLNAGDSVKCSFDVSKMSMDNIAKFYIMISTPDYSGTLYFDNFITDRGTVATFDAPSDLFKKDGDGAEKFVTDLSLIGGGKSNNIKDKKGTAVLSLAQITLKGRKLQIAVEKNVTIDLSIFNLQGNLVKRFNKSSITSGMNSFALDNLTRGLYIVRASSPYGVQQRQIVIK